MRRASGASGRSCGREKQPENETRRFKHPRGSWSTSAADDRPPWPSLRKVSGLADHPCIPGRALPHRPADCPRARRAPPQADDRRRTSSPPPFVSNVGPSRPSRLLPPGAAAPDHTHRFALQADQRHARTPLNPAVNSQSSLSPNPLPFSPNPCTTRHVPQP